MPRSSVSLLGAVLLVGVTVLLVVVLTVAVTGFAPTEPAETVVIEASADAATGRVSLDHVSGPPLDVRRVTIRVEIDGEPLVHQPPVPFNGATGFNGAPSGPFNQGADPAWVLGESASFVVVHQRSATGSRGRGRGHHPPGRPGRRPGVDRGRLSPRRTRDGPPTHSGTVATVVMAISGRYDGPMSTCSNSSKPAASNMRSASASS